MVRIDTNTHTAIYTIAGPRWNARMVHTNDSQTPSITAAWFASGLKSHAILPLATMPFRATARCSRTPDATLCHSSQRHVAGEHDTPLTTVGNCRPSRSLRSGLASCHETKTTNEIEAATQLRSSVNRTPFRVWCRPHGSRVDYSWCPESRAVLDTVFTRLFPPVAMTTKRKATVSQETVEPIYEVSSFGIVVPIYSNTFKDGGVLYKVSPYRPYTLDGQTQRGRSFTLNQIPMLVWNLLDAYQYGKQRETENASQDVAASNDDAAEEDA